jgi:histidinol dehydrogenase
MVTFIDATKPDAATQLKQLLASRQAQQQGDVADSVREIIKQVQTKGDAALRDYTLRFDRHSLPPEGTIALTSVECEEAAEQCPADVRDALALAADRIRAYHQRQLPEDARFTDEVGVMLGWQWRPLASVGLYVPGGRASYPSSVLMNAIPAQVAGVKRLAMVVPTPDGVLNPAVLVAAQLAGIDEIYPIGGAQAVAALAYGTQSIAPVDKIVGPGNAYVTEAKRQVFGVVGIDTIAGPSEICVVSDAQTPPEWIAADLLSQAEHDPQAQSILLCDDTGFAKRVEAAMEAHLEQLPRAAIARESWQQHGVILLVPDVTQSAEWIDVIAPEHLELAVEDPLALAAQIQHAGAIFLGRHTPEAMGDYIAGPSHVLPTTSAARYASGLSVYDFLKKSSLIGCTPEALAALAPATHALADAEGLDAHALSVAVRIRN